MEALKLIYMVDKRVVLILIIMEDTHGVRKGTLASQLKS